MGWFKVVTRKGKNKKNKKPEGKSEFHNLADGLGTTLEVAESGLNA